MTVGLVGAGDPAPVRSYSLSASGPDSYRISVKRESQGRASGYIGRTLPAGDQIEVAAPRGVFVLGDADGPIVLLSAGIGVTPVLAMLRALVDRGSTRSVWWLHTPTARRLGSWPTRATSSSAACVLTRRSFLTSSHRAHS